MKPISGGVLLVAALLTSPALWAGVVDGTMPIDVTLTRYLIACAVCWVVLSLVTDLIWPTAVDAGPDGNADAGPDADTGAGPDAAASTVEQDAAR